MTQNRIRFIAFPQSWLGRVAAGLASVALLITAFFFAVIFMAIAGVVILGITLRLLWLRHKFNARPAPDVLEGEYSVEQPQPPAAIPHRDDGGPAR